MSQRILVVEDHEENRRIMRDLLTSADIEMDYVAKPFSPRALLAKVREHLK